MIFESFVRNGNIDSMWFDFKDFDDAMDFAAGELPVDAEVYIFEMPNVDTRCLSLFNVIQEELPLSKGSSSLLKWMQMYSKDWKGPYSRQNGDFKEWASKEDTDHLFGND